MTDLQFQFSPGNRADFLVKAPTTVGTVYMPYEIFGAIDNQGAKPDMDPRAGPSSARRFPVSRTRAALDAVAPGPTQPALLSIRVVPCPAGETCAMTFPEVDCRASGSCGSDATQAATSAPDPAHYPPLPPFLRPIVPNRPPQFVQFQILNSAGEFQKNPAPGGRFGIWVKGQNGDRQMQFDDTCANFTAPLDPEGGEEWHISQNGDRQGKPFHVFHIHINPFEVVSTFDGSGNKVTYPEPIWQDSITLPNNTNPNDPNNPSTEVVIRQRYEDYTGVYVLHCHFLGHEDRGMMLTVQTVCPNQPGSFSATSTTQPECTFGQFTPALPPCATKPAP
jgi:FtsP/CotA-like multicopper oxidase with cupredoxin domain